MANEPKTTRQYIFTEGQTRFFFISSGVLMVSSIVGLLLLASARPQGEFFEPDRRQYIETVSEASAALSGGVLNEDGSATIPIEQAIELVAERGVENPFTLDSGESGN